MPDIKFTVSGASNSAARITVKARKFTMIVDEPPELGGDDHGANPVEYILAGLVGCVNVMAHVIAAEMGFTIRELQIDASGTLNPDRLFGKPTADRAGYKQINLKLRLATDADEPTLHQWLGTLRSRCPVSDNLVHPTPVLMELVNSSVEPVSA